MKINNKLLKISKALLLILLLTPSLVSAQASATFSSNLRDVEIGVNDSMLIRGLDSKTSYTCLASQPFTFEVGLSTTVQGPISSISGVLNGSQYPARELPFGIPNVGETVESDANDGRLSFITMESGNYEITIAKWGASAPNRPSSVSCTETSLFAGFNTFVNDFNFIESTNLSNVDTEIKWIATSFDGSMIEGEFISKAGVRTDIDLHSLVGTQKYGTIKFNINGLEKNLLIRVSQYQLVDGLVVQRSSEQAIGRTSRDIQLSVIP